jgi:hypothetical protein
MLGFSSIAEEILPSLEQQNSVEVSTALSAANQWL